MHKIATSIMVQVITSTAQDSLAYVASLSPSEFPSCVWTVLKVMP